MGYNAGTYTRNHNFSADASANIKILAVRVDTELDDLASALTNVVWTRDGNTVPTVDIPMGGKRHINVGAPTSVNNYLRAREFIENIPIFMDDTASSADRISVSAQYFTSVSANQAPGDGTRILVRVLSHKSSAALYLNGHSANVEFQDGNRAAAAMVSGGIYEMLYSSVDVAWKITRPDDGRTAAEISAGIVPTNFRYPAGDVRRYGAIGNGSTDNSTAIANAIAALPSEGGVLKFPEGVFNFSSTIDCDGRSYVTIEGVRALSGGAQNGTSLVYTGTGSRFISARSTYGFRLRDLQIQHSSAGFAGYLLDGSHSAAATDTQEMQISGCLIGATTTMTAAIGINFDKVICSSIVDCVFNYLSFAISGQNPAGGSYSNAIHIERCQFINTNFHPILYGGEAWSITRCTFEGRTTGGVSGVAGAVSAVTNEFLGLHFVGNWLGDVEQVASSNGQWLYLLGKGISIIGNRFGGNSTSHAISLNATTGTVITGNTFDIFADAISFDTATCENTIEGANYYTSVTTVFQSKSNQNAATMQWASGHLEGSATYDPANLVDGDGVTTTVTVTGAVLGDFAQATFSLNLQGIQLTAWVSATNTVSVRFQNETGGAIDLSSGTLRARVDQVWQ